MNKNIVKYIGVLLLSSMMSCADFLDVKPLDSFTGDAVFSDLKLTQTYVNKRYTELRDGFGNFGLRYISDEAYHNFNSGNPYLYNRGEVTPDQMGDHSTWNAYYEAIKNCNIFFDNIDLLKADQQKKDQLIGEVTFLRAFFYADLIARFGGVPLVVKTFNLDDDMKIPRNTYQQCVEFVVSELDKAASLLPVVYSSAEHGRATKGAALALKSRVLLYAASPYWNTSNDQSKWKAAADAAKAVIDLQHNGATVYRLHSDYKELFLGNTSPEIIFMKQFNTEFGHSFDWTDSPNGFTGWSRTCVLQDMVDAYEMADGSMPKSQDYVDGVPWLNREPRFYASVVCDGQQFRGREIEFYISSSGNRALSGMDSEFGIDDWNFSKTHYTIRKFMNESRRNPWNDKGDQPWIYFRLGEIYLNYAEAMYQLGDETTARSYINKIRERARGGNNAVLPDITVSGNTLHEKIQHERRIELAFEDHRFFDVRRWKIAEITENKPARKVSIIRDDNTNKKTYKIEVLQERKFFKQHYLLPIPRSEIQRNILLEQNPDYQK
ncbi:RagB/SusD family nutrient uptake outer membrane protein [Sphingobacterium yanglingense]|uniref:Putative outer membrane starch-binding protein n=1 Tax=Sphingobacterium yanglingense TaxID=1437280 RepID=A0A4R6WDX3_9SPHI|nr:RagB/SusD family nutrient uptake outer membrane protein [Sphingobacterium yanglingense]TDQ77933.1 putative outer membrane starch-binding protein [Sphingobacterium yanglingense]